MSKRVYIATGLENAPKHKEVLALLAARGWELTYDWTPHGSVEAETLERKQEVACREVSGVQDADVLVVLMPGGRGTHTEIGIALGACIPIVMFSEDTSLYNGHKRLCIFYVHPSITHVSAIEDIPDACERALGPD